MLQVDESGMMVCVVSGRCFDMWLDSADGGVASDEDNGQRDDGGPGALGRAYLNGYDCQNEAELEVALWGGAVRNRSGRKTEARGRCA
jgi:hypothetical protein